MIKKLLLKLRIILGADFCLIGFILLLPKKSEIIRLFLSFFHENLSGNAAR